MVYSHLCWQCFEKTRKCQEHINTLRKKEKLIFLKPILDIKTKTCWSSWKGTKVLVPPAFLAGLSWKNMPTNDQIIAPSHWSKLLQWIWRSIFTGYIMSKIFPAHSKCEDYCHISVCVSTFATATCHGSTSSSICQIQSSHPCSCSWSAHLGQSLVASNQWPAAIVPVTPSEIIYKHFTQEYGYRI